jgi:predicted dehydrogenase
VEPQAAQETAERAGGVRWTRDYHDLLAAEDVEAVLISLPIYLAAQVIIESVRAGKHVLCEKPLAANLAQAREVLAAVRHAPVVVEIGENYHYRASIRQAREWIAAGRVGQVFLIDLVSTYWHDITTGFSATPWRWDTQYRGGPILDAGVHQTALLRELGGEVEQLQAFTRGVHRDLRGPDTLVLNLRFRSEALGRLMFSAAAVETEKVFVDATVLGSEGTIVFEDERLRLLRRGEAEEVYAIPKGDNGYYEEFLNFYQAITAGAPVVATPEEAYRDFEILMRALDSAESRSVILLNG